MGESAIRAGKEVSKIVGANEIEEANIVRLANLIWHGYKFIDIKIRKDGVEHEFQGDWLMRLFHNIQNNQ